MAFFLSSAFTNLSTDVIGETAFGLDLDAQNNPDEPFRKTTKEIFAQGQPDKRPWIFQLAGNICPRSRHTAHCKDLN